VRDWLTAPFLPLRQKLPFGSVVNKGLAIKSGQTHVQRYSQSLQKKIESGQIDRSFVITHLLPLEEGARGLQDFSR
jgi:threonine dehydrogenase-like Zn-dependent dehydrogenase